LYCIPLGNLQGTGVSN